MQPNFEIIAAMDLIGGRCTRLRQGDFSTSTTYEGSPLDIALRFEEIGISRLHIVDLEGARLGRSVHLQILETIASRTNLIIDFGGGISSTNILKDVFDAGARYAAIGSIAVKNLPLLKTWIEDFGAERFFISADIRDGHISIHGWQESSEIKVNDFINRMKQLGIGYFHCTDISKDGMLTGPATDLYRQIITAHPDIRTVASGGIRHLKDIELLAELGCAGAIIGKAFYEELISLNELKDFLKKY